MSLASDPIDQAFPEASAAQAPFVGDPIDQAFAEKAESPVADVSDPEGEAARALSRGSRQLVGVLQNRFYQRRPVWREA